MNLYLNVAKWTDGDLVVIAIIAIEVQLWLKTTILAFIMLWFASTYKKILSEGQCCHRSSKWRFAIHQNLWFMIWGRCLRFQLRWVHERVPWWWMDEVYSVVDVAFFCVEGILWLIAHLWLIMYCPRRIDQTLLIITEKYLLNCTFFCCRFPSCDSQSFSYP